jgi:hypothetical protein
VAIAGLDGSTILLLVHIVGLSCGTIVFTFFYLQLGITFSLAFSFPAALFFLITLGATCKSPEIEAGFWYSIARGLGCLCGKVIRDASSSSSNGTILFSHDAVVALFLFFGDPLHQHENNT